MNISNDISCDWLVVGGGSAGCVLAARLSEDPSRRVILVEAGPDTPPDQVPASITDNGFLPDYFSPIRYWTDLTAYSDPPGNRSRQQVEAELAPSRYEQGRVMGGGSAVNAQIAIRGLPADYDEWAAMGAQGWDFDSCLPYFRKLERDMDFDGELHGDSGPIPLRRTFPEDWSRFALSFRDALAKRDIPYVDDGHAYHGDSCFPFARNNIYGKRVSAAIGYLDTKTRRRPNLRILPLTILQQLTFDGTRCTGAELSGPQGRQHITAGEVIISCGALHTPAVLLRAGIGPGADLAAMGIAMRADRPGVGQNLLDHPLLGFGVHIAPEGRMAEQVRNNLLLHLRWSSQFPGCTPTDMKLTVSGRFAWSRVGKRLGTLNFGPNKSYSRGEVALRSPDPAVEPYVALNLLSDPRDMARMKYGVRWVHDILSADPVRSYVHSWWPGIFAASVRNLIQQTRWNRFKTDIAAGLLDSGAIGRKIVLGAAIDTRFTLAKILADERILEDWIRAGTQGDWHPCGTCRMGAADDAMAVTDPQGRVLGVEGLRVVDASLMPSIPCANPNITVIMMAEKIAAGIRAEG
ncbi:GMC family oxidoreductase [Humitalea sp. 24SJ18S-53]|uniref:GMC family oxidoreductase n=1 Tax=Humitalea sp. 24SJ18S-53 TaxID=3422307 RepID=UPI003D66476B